MMLRRTTLWAIAVVVITSRVTIGQELRGTVLDSASRQSIPGSVLMLLNATGAVLGRNITNERGEYRVALTGEMRRVRFVRIGYRPRELPIPAENEPRARLDVTMVPIPAFLTPVQVTVNPRCPRRPDHDAAFALYEQARAGLLAAVVARETNPGNLVRLQYDRMRDGPSLDDQIVRQEVKLDSAGQAATSFEAAHSARDFVRDGFVELSGDRGEFFGPDADALLDDAFGEGYCFRVADPDRARPSEVGLAFAPADHRDGRVDIDGVLWIDTVARALRDIDYRYVGLDARATRAVRAGGTVSFVAMPNGVVFIDRWSIRMPQTVADTLGRRRGAFVPYGIAMREVGGEIGRADWPGGTTWVGSLGALRLHVVDRKGHPVRHAGVRLNDTDYRGVTDSLGDVEIRHVVPGPYWVVVIDSSLANLDVVFGAPTRLVARRDSVIHATVVAPRVEEFTGDRCGGSGLEAATARAGDRAWLLAVVVGDDGKPVTDANWELRRRSSGSWTLLASGRGTGGKEGEQYCWAATVGDALQVRVWRDGQTPATVRYDITKRSALLRLELPRD